LARSAFLAFAPADLSPGESEAVEPWRPAPLLVYAADRKMSYPGCDPEGA